MTASRPMCEILMDETRNIDDPSTSSGCGRKIRLWWLPVGFCFALLMQGASIVAADDSTPDFDNLVKQLTSKQNLIMKTFGGRQFWGDVHFFHEWTIQKNVFTDHYRLLDGDDYRHASGTFEECQTKLDEIKESKKLPPMSGKAVLLIHGIVRSSKSFRKIHESLEKDGYRVFGFDYPSTRIGIRDSAEYLHQTIESLEGVEEISLVVHSMGGLVTRAYLSKHRDKRLKRLVMIGVPNRGARMADTFRKNLLYRAVYGPAGQQLVSDSDGLISSLPTPDFEFAVIAGAKGDGKGYNPLVPGDDDGTVSLTSTRLIGAADFATVPCLHSSLMGHEDVVDYTVRFIKNGRLCEKGDREPIAAAEKSDFDQPAEKP